MPRTPWTRTAWKSTPWKSTPWKPVVALLVIFTALASACSSSTTDSGAPVGTAGANKGAPKDEGPPVDGGTLRVALGADLDGTYPVQARWSLEGNLVGSALYDTLMTFDEQRRLVPRLAESVTPNSDATVWTIKVRPGVKFHDGTTLDADAVAANIAARKAIPITGSALKFVQNVSVTDPNTVQVTMTAPWFGYDYTLAAQGGYMVAPSMLQDPDAMRKAVGTGPFKLEGEYSQGQPIKLVRNDNYWGDKPHLAGLEFRTIADQNQRTQSLRSGDVDLIFSQEPQAVVNFRDADGFVQVEDVAAEETFAMLSFNKPPFDNENARKALAYGTDRKAINELVAGGIQEDANQPYTTSEQYYVQDSKYPEFDPAKAKEYVAAYEKETGQKLTFSLSTPSSNQQRQEAQVLQAQWRDIGAEVDIKELEQAAFLSDMFFGKFQAAMFRNFAYVNPDSNYIFWHSSYGEPAGGGINFGNINSPKLDAALDAARSTPDESVRVEKQKEVVQALNETLPYIWLYHTDWGLAGTDKVGGLSVPQKLGFARQDGKPWWPALWLKQ